MIGLPLNMSLSDICGQTFTSKEDLQAFLTNGGILNRKQALQDEINATQKAYQEALGIHMQAYREV